MLCATWRLLLVLEIRVSLSDLKFHVTNFLREFKNNAILRNNIIQVFNDVTKSFPISDVLLRQL